MHTTRHQKFAAFAIAIGATIVFATHRSGAANAQPAAAAEPPPAVVEVASATASSMVPLQWVPGSVGSRHDARIASTESGRVIEIAEVGTAVRRGDLIARVDDEAHALAVRQAEANLQRAESRSSYAQRQAERMESITQRSSVAEAQLDQIRADRDERRQETLQAKAALADAQRRWRDASIRAPFNGTVAERFVEIGEHLAAGAPVLRLVDTVDLEVSARAPVAMASVLKAGSAVQVRENRALHSAKLRAVVPVGDTQSRQLEVRIALPASTWTVGSAVEVGLPSDAARAGIAVPRDALVLRNDGTYVFRIDADGKAERLDVETGESQGDLVEVSGDVMAGDVLVTRGAERLQPGQKVKIIGADAVAELVSDSRG
jgi:RND family efflux transporter MFP subunit